MPSVAITTLVDSSASIILEITKLGYSVSLWSTNNPYLKTLNGPGGLILLNIQNKISDKKETATELVNKISNMLQQNEIPYFSLVIFTNDNSCANSGDLKPKKLINPTTDKNNVKKTKEVKKENNKCHLTVIK